MLKIDFFQPIDFKDHSDISANAIVIPVFEDSLDSLFSSAIIKENHKKVIEEVINLKSFEGKFKSIYVYQAPFDSYERIILFGLGKRKDFSYGVLREAVGEVVPLLVAGKRKIVFFDLSYEKSFSHVECIESVLLSQYSDNRFKSDAEEAFLIERIYFFIHTKKDPLECVFESEVANHTCFYANWARDMANSPSNFLTPSKLADEALKIVDTYKGEEGEIKHKIFNLEEIKKNKMGALFAVSQGSYEEPRFISLEYRHKKAKKTVAFVGKAITFDTGGISLKPSASMEEMKYDMCGGAAVLGAFHSIASLNLPINVIGVVPATENCIGSKAVKPGDIITSYSGKTIEVLNTDAEGRLILADALAYTCRHYKPDFIIDLATLTGACVVALGHSMAGMVSNNDKLSKSLTHAGEQVNELLWRLPLNNYYKSLMKGKLADLTNLGPRYAGTITAGAFLSNFVEEGIPWAHIDIAGVAWNMEGASYIKKGTPSSFGVRLLVEWVIKSLDLK